MRRYEEILAGFAIGATLWILFYNAEQEQAARDAADSVLDALIQEGMK